MPVPKPVEPIFVEPMLVEPAPVMLEALANRASPKPMVANAAPAVASPMRLRRFSGGMASSNPPLNDEGRAQIRATGEWLSPMRDHVAPDLGGADDLRAHLAHSPVLVGQSRDDGRGR